MALENAASAIVNVRVRAVAQRVQLLCAYRWVRVGKRPIPASRVGGPALIDEPAISVPAGGCRAKPDEGVAMAIKAVVFDLGGVLENVQDDA